MSAMPTFPERTCSCCQQPKSERFRALYDHPVCRKCYHGLAWRRQFAWFIDLTILGLIYSIAVTVVVAALAIAAFPPEVLAIAQLACFGVYLIAFLGKDALGGRTPGRALLGLQVVDATNGEPIGFVASAKRNLINLLPFAPLFVAFDLMKGKRIGDGWANTKVTWHKYANSPMFNVDGATDSNGIQFDQPSDTSMAA